MVDTRDPRYAEAIEEREYYDDVALGRAEAVTESEIYQWIERAMAARGSDFPEPHAAWIDSRWEGVAEIEAYRYLAPLGEKVVLQLGGGGLHAVKFLLAGAAEAWLVTPMRGEAEFARRLAVAAGVGERFQAVVAVAEELPFEDATFDVVYSGGAIHHTVTDQSFPEIARILRDGGRFAAIDPWRAVLYSFGTWVFGKREPEIGCRPLSEARVASIKNAFRRTEIRQHGTFTRYLFLALEKLGLRLPHRLAWSLTRLDDLVSHRFGVLRRQGSCVALLAEK